MGVILDLAPTVVVSGGVGGGSANVDLSDVYEKIQTNKDHIGDLTALATDEKTSLSGAVNEVHELLQTKANLDRVMAIEKYLVALEERLNKVDIQIMDPRAILFLD